jgi:excisionase family DNA binding protein
MKVQRPPRARDDLDEPFFTVQEVAERFKVTKYTVRNWIKDGAMRAMRFGGRGGYRISRAELRRFENERLEDALPLW